MAIQFWKISEHGMKLPYGDFSNFSHHSFVVDDLFYRTSEHYYQSKKFLHMENQRLVIDCESPRMAADTGRRPDLPLREDWESIKDEVMFKALQLKFGSYEELKILLLSTGDQLIQEDNPYDEYWGTGKEGLGKNKLGALLMLLRHEIRREKGEINE